ncbi:MAG TPA: hypothetical protein VFM11_11845 [Burkholderiales bacterium]|nr:hypothetical protein [Burkholderiales bacterium]
MMRKNRMSGSNTVRTHMPRGDSADDTDRQPPPAQPRRRPAYQFVAVDGWHPWKY